MPRSPSRSGPGLGLWAADRLLGDRLGPRHGVRTLDERPDRANVDGVRRGRRRRLGVRRRSVRPVPPGPSLAAGDGDVGRISIVAENGIMQRRTPDTVRSRTMAAMEAVLSWGWRPPTSPPGRCWGSWGLRRSTRSRACSRLVQPWYFSRSSACGPTRSATRPRTRCPATDYRGPGDCVILALDGGGRQAHVGAAGRAGAGHLPGREPGRVRRARVHRLPPDGRIRRLALDHVAAHDGRPGARPAPRELVRRPLRPSARPRRLGSRRRPGFVALAFARTPGQLVRSRA